MREPSSWGAVQKVAHRVAVEEQQCAAAFPVLSSSQHCQINWGRSGEALFSVEQPLSIRHPNIIDKTQPWEWSELIWGKKHWSDECFVLYRLHAGPWACLPFSGQPQSKTQPWIHHYLSLRSHKLPNFNSRPDPTSSACAGQITGPLSLFGKDELMYGKHEDSLVNAHKMLWRITELLPGNTSPDVISVIC